MPDSLVDLESRRAAVQLQITQLGDMRSGSITGTGGRCGNPNCHCYRAGDSGHGPYFRLTRKVQGKTVTETFSSPASLAKARREVAECQRFRELGEQTLEYHRTDLCLAGQWWRPRRRPRKKNGRSDPKGSRARSRPTVVRSLWRAPQNGAFRPGSHGDGCTLGHAPGRRHRADKTVAVPSSISRPAEYFLPLRSSGSLPGVTLQTGPYCGRQLGSVAPLLLVPPLPKRPIPHRCRVGH